MIAGTAPRGARATWVLIAVGALAACVGDRTPRDAANTVRDSAGVRIVESVTPRWTEGQVWKLSEEPRRRIGDVDGPPDAQLYGVVDARLLTDGRVIVANQGSNEVRVFGPDGRLQLSLGGEGDGPGEFRLLWRVFVTGDSVIAYDRKANRLTVFTVDGRLVRVSTLPTVNNRPPPRVRGLFGDGSFLGVALAPFWGAERTSLYRSDDTFLRIGPEGGVLDTLGTFPGDETYVEVQGAGAASMAIPFPRTGVTAVASDGFYFGSNDSYEVGRYSPNGELKELIRVGRPNRRVSQDDLDAFVANLTSRAPSEEVRQRLETHYRRMPLPDEMPAYSRLLVDGMGNLWVENYSGLFFGPSDWSVFDPQGGWLGAVRLPADFTPYQIGEDHVLGRSTDSLGVEYVDIYDLSKLP